MVQSEKNGNELISYNYPSLIALINGKLTEANIKEKASDVKPLPIRSVHRHPSNDVVIYTTTTQQAEAIRKQGDKWIALLSPCLKLHLPVHTVVVHCIPASFQPSDPQHLEMLAAMNPETMTPSPVFVKWVSLNAIQRGSSDSSIRIGFTNADQARRAVEQNIFYGKYSKCTEYGRKTKTRCMNCLEEGHASHHCKGAMMCPYCAADHAADKRELRGKTTSNCTSCARAILKKTPDTNLKILFSTTPVHLHHSPLDPTCPTRLEAKKQEAAKAALASKTAPTSILPPKKSAAGTVPTVPGPSAIIELDAQPAAAGATSEDTQMADSQ